MKLSLQVILAAIAANAIAAPVNCAPPPWEHPPHQYVSPHCLDDHQLTLTPLHNLAEPRAPPPFLTLDQLHRADQLRAAPNLAEPRPPPFPHAANAATLRELHQAAATAYGKAATALARAVDVVEHHRAANTPTGRAMPGVAPLLKERRIAAEKAQALHTTAAQQPPRDWDIQRTRHSQISAIQEEGHALNLIRYVETGHLVPQLRCQQARGIGRAA